MKKTKNNLRMISIEPGLPAEFVRSTFEGNLLWGILNLKVGFGQELVPLFSSSVKGEGAFYYAIGTSTIQWWLDAAEQSKSDLAKVFLREISKGDDHFLGEFDFNEWIDAEGELMVTLPIILQAILNEHPDVVQADCFTIRTVGGEYGDAFAAGAAVVTADAIHQIDLDDWVRDTKLTNKVAMVPSAVGLKA
jgi:hypothetical protein